MSDLLGTPPGATPLSPEDVDGLIPTWIATRSELNRAEQDNIATATAWALGLSPDIRRISPEWLVELHRRMFGGVWRWAGAYRHVDTNLGVPWFEIPTSVDELILDLRAQTGDVSNLPWSADEVAVRFHHRLVSIHPFPNGNGRHARLAADAVVISLGGNRLAWGTRGARAPLEDAGPTRARYLAALRRADDESDYADLVAFAREG